mgnify:FL=1
MGFSNFGIYVVLSILVIYYLIEIILIKKFSIKLYGIAEIPSRLNFIGYIKYWTTKFKAEGISNLTKFLIIIWIGLYVITIIISISFIGIIILNFFKIKII